TRGRPSRGVPERRGVRPHRRPLTASEIEEGPGGRTPGPTSVCRRENRLLAFRRALPHGTPRPPRSRRSRSLLGRLATTTLLGRRLRAGRLLRSLAALLRRGTLLRGLALLGRSLLRSPLLGRPLLGRLLRSRLPLRGRLPLRRRLPLRGLTLGGSLLGCPSLRSLLRRRHGHHLSRRALTRGSSNFGS